jgi:hypothetical protein
MGYMSVDEDVDFFTHPLHEKSDSALWGVFSYWHYLCL